MGSVQSVVRRRLTAHRLAGCQFPDPAAAVAHYGAVQAQEYLASLWALGLRTANATERAIEQAIADRAIIRTWPLRRTIHYVAAADARWILKLTAERSLKAATRRIRELELDDDTFRRSREVITKALMDHEVIAREALTVLLEEAGVSTAGQQGYYILWYHAHEGLIGIGPRSGKQQAFVLLDEWLPPGLELTRDEALAELARRYFTGHGPATLVDYTWWSGLVAAEARAGLEMVKGELTKVTIDGQDYWFGATPPDNHLPTPLAHLLPVYDEYTVGYKDRSAILRPDFAARPDSGNGIFRSPILIDGEIAGTWTRKLKKNTVDVTPNLFRPLSENEQDAFDSAVERYRAFLGLAAAVDAVS
jgi:hypothetical protein